MDRNNYKVTLTLAGFYLENRLHGDEKTLHFTKVEIGDDLLEEDFDVRYLTQIDSVKATLNIIDSRVYSREETEDQVAYVEAEFKNFTVEEGFRIRLIALYAADPDYPNDRSKDIIYAACHLPQVEKVEITDEGKRVVVREETGDWIPAITEDTIVDLTYGLFTVIGQATKVECTIADDIVHITIHTFREHIEHPDPHPNQPHLTGEVEDFNRVLVKETSEQNFHPVTLQNFVRNIAPNIVNAMTYSGTDGKITFRSNTTRPNGDIDFLLYDLISIHWKTPRKITLTGNATGNATFDGSADFTLNVLNNYADVAGKLQTARKISLSGDASGSANFDGSGNVTINVSNSFADSASYATSAGDSDKLDGKTLQWILDQIPEDSGGGDYEFDIDDVMTASFSANGWVKFANGLIFQWMRGGLTGFPTHLSFPISFRTACYAIVGSDIAAQNHPDGFNPEGHYLFFGNVTASGFDVGAANTSNGSIDDTGYSIIAVGK